MTSTYRLEVEPIAGAVTAFRGRRALFQTAGAKLMRETRLPDCPYFPKEALMGLTLSPSHLRTFCPFKGTASYWHAEIDGETIPNAIWSYENALPESKSVEGMIGLMPAFADGVEYDKGAPTPVHDGHVQGALVDWIVREAGAVPGGEELTRRLAERFRENGIAVKRMSVFLWSLHPQIAGVSYLWRDGQDEVQVSHPHYHHLENPVFANSPIRHVSAGLGGVRQPLDSDEVEFQFSILDDLKADGMTDYVAMPLRFSDGATNVLTMATDHPVGFTTANLGLVFECSSAIARYYEVQMLRMNAMALLDTYVGRRAGARVLGGEIRRGDGDDIEAAILFCDLVSSTRWAESLRREEYLSLLNGFFEAVTDAVRAHGGEVLKFIGDAVLAVFPSEADADEARRRGAAAAAAIPGAVAEADIPDEVKVAVGLSFGPVTYGNVGAPDRLDFTVIGTAATVAARLSDLAKAEGCEALVSGDIAAAVTERGEAKGARRLHNIAEPIEVFTLSPAAQTLEGANL